jgi:isopentenyl diphosphate isomerase/L-lactate dehydrogenase-like FMN-dependent dehydrogenase
VAGEAFVNKGIKILQRELQMAMALTGRARVSEVDRSVIWS